VNSDRLSRAGLADRRVVVMGLGRFGGGIGAAQYLLGCGARVLGTDLRQAHELPEAIEALGHTAVELCLGRHDPADFETADVVVANPAVRPDHPLLERARQAGALVTSEVELFMAAARCNLVGITGTQGKSSTTTFVAQLLDAAGRRVHAGGNLGGSLLEHVAVLGADEWVVLELSSYQLEALASPPANARAFRAVAVTNIELDHLERHGDLAGYAAAKRRILELAGDDTVAWLPDGPGPCADWRAVKGRVERFDPQPGTQDVVLADGERAPGPRSLGLPAFQAANLRLAYGLVRGLGLTLDEVRRGAARLSPPPHRLERLPDLGGAAVYDNGVSTTPDSTASALASLEAPVVLLVGGKLKDLPLAPLVEAARRNTRVAVTFGAAAEHLAAELARGGVRAEVGGDLRRAVAVAAGHVRPGDALVFSPACASFDAFPNFKERAASFRAALEEVRRAADGVVSR
jgi:UDP-N-acetylmuramoylalanine--D-glutamate ligase